MGTGYSRNDTSNNIADGNIINAADLDGEFDAIQSAFNASTGHTHDGTTAEGAPITVTGPVQDYVSSATEFRPKTNNTYDLGSLSLQWKDLYVDGTGYIDSVDIDGGAIDGTTIGGSSAAAGSFTTLGASGNATVGGTLGVTGLSTLASVDINGGNIDGTTIGSASAAAGTFTTATATTGNITTVNATTVDSTNVEVTNIKAKDGTASATVADSTGVMTIASSVLTTTDINGGTIDGVTIGGSSAGAITGTTITGSSFVTTGDMTFGDNDKAIFGAGSDLQIYHDGSKSLISDQGQGNLVVAADNFEVNSASNTANKITAQTGGAVNLFFNNQNKLSTTSTGVDVTGTVTADGLTVETAAGTSGTIGLLRNSSSAASGNAAYLDFKFDNTFSGNNVDVQVGAIKTNAGNEESAFVVKTTEGTGTPLERFRAGANGDISFYEDTGTTPKFFWDASAESLGIGTSSPITALQISGTNATVTLSDTNASGGSYSSLLFRNTDGLSNTYNIASVIGLTTGNGGNGALAFYTASSNSNTERMRIDSAGRVGIGTSSPAYSLDINGISGVRIAGGASDTYIIPEFYGSGVSSILTGSGAKSLALGVNGAERLRIDSSGNVGISINKVFGSGNGYAGNTAAASSGTLELWDTSGHVNLANNWGSGAIKFTVGASERMRIDSSGNVGIGTSSNDSNAKLEVIGNIVGRTSNAVNANTDFRLMGGAYTGNPATVVTVNGTSGTNEIIYGGGTGSGEPATQHRFNTGTAGTKGSGTERMRIDSSGRLLVGKTSNSNSTAGTTLYGNGKIEGVRDGGSVHQMNRLTSDGSILDFQKDGTTVGNIGVKDLGGALGPRLFIGSTDTGLFFQGETDNAITPCQGDSGATRDNALDLGSSSARFDDIYATNALIQTSDRNEKQDIAELDEAERRVAVAAKGLLRKFRWRDAVAEKGDDARIHFGIIAQDLQAAFAAEGLDAGKYAMFIHTTWTDEETGEERSRMGVRYSELLAFIIAAI